MYRQLVPDRPGEQAGLIHPDPSVDLARVAAKKLLCRAALGEDPPDRGRPRGFRPGLPGAAGTLAGRDGPYVADRRRRRWTTTSSPPRRSPTAAGRPSPARRPGPRSSRARSTSARCSGGSTWSRSTSGTRDCTVGWNAAIAMVPGPDRPRTGSWPTIRSSWATRLSSATRIRSSPIT